MGNCLTLSTGLAEGVRKKKSRKGERRRRKSVGDAAHGVPYTIPRLGRWSTSPVYVYGTLDYSVTLCSALLHLQVSLGPFDLYRPRTPEYSILCAVHRNASPEKKTSTASRVRLAVSRPPLPQSFYRCAGPQRSVLLLVSLPGSGPPFSRRTLLFNTFRRNYPSRGTPTSDVGSIRFEALSAARRSAGPRCFRASLRGDMPCNQAP